MQLAAAAAAEREQQQQQQHVMRQCTLRTNGHCLFKHGQETLGIASSRGCRCTQQQQLSKSTAAETAAQQHVSEQYACSSGIAGAVVQPVIRLNATTQ
jgi:hypothetical protein